MTTSFPVSILIVSYNTRDLLDGCLRSLRRTAEDLPLEIIVVDNASTDGSAERLRSHFPDVKLICCERNIGFAAAVNRGMAKVHSQFVFVLNPDTLVPRETIRMLLKYIEIDSKCAVIGAQLTDADGSPQASMFRFPSLFREFWNFLPELKWLFRLQKIGTYVETLRFSGREESGQLCTVRSVHCISGAAFMVRTEAFREVGGMDERFFLYHEEMDFCTRLLKSSWGVYTHFDAQVIHFDAQASGYKRQRMPRSPLLYWRIGGMNLLWQKHRGGIPHELWRMQAKGLLRLRITLCFLALPFSGNRRDGFKQRIRELQKTIQMLNVRSEEAG